MVLGEPCERFFGPPRGQDPQVKNRSSQAIFFCLAHGPYFADTFPVTDHVKSVSCAFDSTRSIKFVFPKFQIKDTHSSENGLETLSSIMMRRDLKWKTFKLYFDCPWQRRKQNCVYWHLLGRKQNVTCWEKWKTNMARKKQKTRQKGM